MFTTVYYADLTITFHFSNGTTLPIYVGHDESEDNQWVEDVDIKTALSSLESNPLGSVAASTLDISLSDFNSDFFPNNEQSPYYGYMDRTCYITVDVTKLYIDSEDESASNVPQEQTLQTPISLGTFYVDSWTSENSSSDIFGVKISASDLISTIGNMEVPIVSLDPTQDALTYLRNVVSALNSRLPAYKRIVINQNASFGTFDNDIRYRNLKSDGKVIDLLNQLSHCLLCNIYVGRDNTLIIDSILDDISEQSVYTLSDETNIIDIKVEDGLLVDYSGASVNFPVDRSGPAIEIGRISEQSFDDLEFTNFHFNGGLFKLAYMVISSTTDVCPTVDTMRHDNTEMDITFDYNGTEPASTETYTVTMYGGMQESGYVSTSEVTDDSVCVFENDLINKAYISDYLDDINAFMSNKRSGITCSGYFDPSLKLGDVVTINSSLLNVSNDYKVTSLTWHISDTFSCDAEMRSITDFGEEE